MQIGKCRFCRQKRYAIMAYIERSIRQLQSKFQKQAKMANLWHRGREVHSEAFISICSLVEDQVITGGDVLGLKDAFNNYVLILEDLGAENLVASYTAQKLEEKLKLHFKKHIIIHKGKYKRGGSLTYHHLRRSFEVLLIFRNQNWINISKMLSSLLVLSSKTQPVQISLQVK